MPDKSLRMRRAGGDGLVKRPVMLAIAGDSAAGRTTMARGLVEALGPERCVSLCTVDYHRYDREERKELPALGAPETPQCLGRLGDARSEPLAIAQLLLLYHLTGAAR